MHASRAGDVVGSTKDYDTITWTLSTPDPMEKVVAFYKDEYPDEVKEAQAKDGYDGSVLSFTIKPDGGGRNDRVEFDISQEQIIIVQVRLAK